MNQFAKSLLFVGILMIAASPAFAVLTATHLQDADLSGVFASQQYVGEGRAGDGAATATYEIGVGGTLGAPTVMADYTWVKNAIVSFLVDYNATTNIVTFVIDGVFVQETIVLSTTTEILLRAASGRNNVDVRIDNIVVDGEAVIDSVTASLSHDILWISGATIADGLLIEGNMLANWGGQTPPVGDEISFTVELANTSAVPTKETTWGRVKALHK